MNFVGIRPTPKSRIVPLSGIASPGHVYSPPTQRSPRVVRPADTAAFGIALAEKHSNAGKKTSFLQQKPVPSQKKGIMRWFGRLFK